MEVEATVVVAEEATIRRAEVVEVAGNGTTCAFMTPTSRLDFEKDGKTTPTKHPRRRRTFSTSRCLRRLNPQFNLA